MLWSNCILGLGLRSFLPNATWPMLLREPKRPHITACLHVCAACLAVLLVCHDEVEELGVIDLFIDMLCTHVCAMMNLQNSGVIDLRIDMRM